MMQLNTIDAGKSKLIFETTVNIDKKVYQKISEAAKRYGVSRSRLIAMLFERFVCKEEIPNKSRGTVAHQQARAKEDWKKLHVALPAHVHDFFDDVRKLWKMSVSFLVAVLVEKFLDQLDENEIRTFADKYWHGAHTIIHFVQNDLQYVLCCWGIPQQKPEIPIR